MKAILIDPQAKTISEIQIKDWKDIAPALSTSSWKVNLFCLGGTVPAKHGDNALYVDDEGLFNENQFFFYAPKFHPAPLAGKGLILGTDREGESVDCSLTVEEVKQMVSW